MRIVVPVIFIEKFFRSEAEIGLLFASAAIASTVLLFLLSLRATITISPPMFRALCLAMLAVAIGVAVSTNMAQYSVLFIGYVLLRSLFVIHLRSERNEIVAPENLGKVIGVMVALLALPIAASGAFVAALDPIAEPGEILLAALLLGSALVTVAIVRVTRTDSSAI